ncbi:MAG: galactose mutarotase [Bacteroidales bacterium]|nr:galactose mutarotase [Bacteroidales bacterium]
MITINKSLFGQIDGKEIYLYTISSGNDMTVRITNFGGIVTSVMVPDRNGTLDDVVLGFDSIGGYTGVHPYFGCIVGRCANRIAGAKFKLDGKIYQLAKNIGDNHLHGGINGFDKKIWNASEFRQGDEAGIELTCTSPDGEEGYPGNLKVTVIYTLTPNRELKIRYSAETDKPTPINLTHHGYFNLKGAGNGDILDHELMINADRYNVVNDQLLPTGELREVSGTAMDFRKSKFIGRDMALVEGGYDHNFVLNVTGEVVKVAVLREASTGRWMEVHTSQPGMQFYGGNFLDGTITGKKGRPYYKHYGLCLETQHFPDSPNQPSFPNTILRPGETFQSVTIYKFGTTP